ncbi:hypothetical protein N7G274_005361 [Stereocaulon virgatum]|uniref:Uncharacterized protein n=1 Tax=Stereocaulon virgatum TaxID=373712 RepID=A0ABR4AFM2_9LECA
MTCIRSRDMEIVFDHYAQAVTAFRNLRWWGMRKRQECIMEANKVSLGVNLSAESERQKSSSASHRDIVPSEPESVPFDDIYKNELGNAPPMNQVVKRSGPS